MSHHSTTHYRCGFCGRPLWSPAVYIDRIPIGPTCAKRAGLLTLARKGNAPHLRIATERTARPKTKDTDTRDMFEDQPA